MMLIAWIVDLGLPVYAAVASTAAIGWRVFEWYSERHLKVTVTADHLDRSLGDGIVESFFVAKVHNRNSFPVRVKGATFVSTVSPPERPSFFTGSEVGLERTVLPHDAEDVEIPIYTFRGGATRRTHQGKRPDDDRSNVRVGADPVTARSSGTIRSGGVSGR